jgi:hypothetical protein
LPLSLFRFGERPELLQVRFELVSLLVPSYLPEVPRLRGPRGQGVLGLLVTAEVDEDLLPDLAALTVGADKVEVRTLPPAHCLPDVDAAILCRYC